MVDMKKKLQSRSGETLSEALISVLIVSLASVMLATMISAASSMNIRTKNYDEALDKALIGMTSDSSTPGTVTMTFDDTTTVTFDVNVKSYSPEDGDSNIALSSYAPKPDSDSTPDSAE